MANTIVEQNTTFTPDYTALTYKSMRDEVVGYVRSRYEKEGIQDDYLQTNAAVMMIDSQSYIGNLAGQRADDLVHEVWLQTANRRENALKTVRTLGQKPILPRAAKLPVQILFETTPNINITMQPLYPFSVKGLDGTTIQFEAMFDDFDYYSQIILPAGVKQHKVYFYEGTTYQDTFQSTGAARQEYVLRNFPVIQGSVFVSLSPIPPNVITSDEIIAARINEVQSLVTNIDEYIYTTDVSSKNEVVVRFATDEFGKIPPKGWYIYVDYRVGGGTRGNIPVGTVNQTLNLRDDSGVTRRALFANTQSGATGGFNQETLEQIAERVPSEVASSNKVCQRYDYETQLTKLLPDTIEGVYVLDYMTARKINRSAPIVPQNGVFLWILPLNSDVLDEDQRQIIMSYLEDELRLIAIEHYLFDPDYLDWNVNAKLYVDRTINQDKVETAIRQELLSKYGKYDLEGNPTKQLKFNRVITVSSIISVMQQYIGGFGSENYVQLIDPSANLDPSLENPPRYGQMLRLDNENINIEFILREEQ